MNRAVDFYERWLNILVTVNDPLFSIFEIDGFRLCLFNFEKTGEEVVFGDNLVAEFTDTEGNDVEIYQKQS